MEIIKQFKKLNIDEKRVLLKELNKIYQDNLNNLIKLLFDKGLIQKQISLVVGINQQNVSKRLKGDK